MDQGPFAVAMCPSAGPQPSALSLQWRGLVLEGLEQVFCFLGVSAYQTWTVRDVQMR